MKKLCLLIGLALVLAASSTSAQLIFEDNFNGYTNGTAIAGNNGWYLTDSQGTGHAGPVAINGQAVYQMDGDPAGQLNLKRELGTRDTGTLNAYWDIGVDSAHADGISGNIAILSFFNSTGGEVWRMRVHSGHSDGNLNNFIDVLTNDGGFSAPQIIHPAMGAMTNIWVSYNLDAKTFDVNVNGDTVLGSKTSYFGMNNIASFQWASYAYKDSQNWLYATTTMDNVAFYMNEERPVVPEPSSFMALGMFGLGALGYIKRRRA